MAAFHGSVKGKGKCIKTMAQHRYAVKWTMQLHQSLSDIKTILGVYIENLDSKLIIHSFMYQKKSYHWDYYSRFLFQVFKTITKFIATELQNTLLNVFEYGHESAKTNWCV